MRAPRRRESLLRRLRRSIRHPLRGLRISRSAEPPEPSAPEGSPGPSRRELLGTLGALPLVGLGASRLGAGEARSTGGNGSGRGPAILITESDRREFERVRDLDLSSPEAVAKQRTMPTAKIGDLSVSRLVCGSNLISMNMHARDLDYVKDLASHYNTEDRVLLTLKKLEEQGCNAIVLKSHNFRRFRLSRYWDEWGGKMHWIADVITTKIGEFERKLDEHLELGASAAYVWGGASDIWYHEKQPESIVKAWEMIRDRGVPAGICAHRLEPLRFLEKEGVRPDFYMKTLHHDRYWSAHPRENREFIEMYRANRREHDRYHDNMFCRDHDETIEFFRECPVPWIAFKVLAAGAIPPKEGIGGAFRGGADFICLGMFDFQVDEDVKITRDAIAAARNRKRPWPGVV